MEEKELRRLLIETVSHALETRKGIATCLVEKRRLISEVDLPKDEEIDASVWNDLGRYFLTNRMYEDAEIVYKHMLDVLKELESAGATMHKGLALYNLGIAQIGTRNFDDGIPNILSAFEEDKRKLGETRARGALASRLQEDLLDFVALFIDNNYLKEFNTGSGMSVQKTYDLFNNLDEVEKLFFAKIVTNKARISFHANIYTRILLYDNLKALCLLLETNLRRRSKGGRTLGRLVGSAFAGEPWIKEYNMEVSKGAVGFAGYQDPADFDSKVQKIAKFVPYGNRSLDFHLRDFLATTLARNLTSHEFAEEVTILNDKREYDLMFANALRSLLFALHYAIPA